MLPVIETILNSGSVLLLCIIMHELGHYMIIKKHGGNTKMVLKGFDLTMKIPDEFTDAQRVHIYFFGIFYGFLPLVTIIKFGVWPALIVCFLYIIGCGHDFNAIGELTE